ncbi:hypothetical protein PVK06_028341 [Gossypium arboreum]|uniref:Uncharacterized protein n=1 Tax=Gossypium arboreum TaxID=29729 RepID=A0ABR0P2S0_GOSAR|nr:hypothetical protein PVK06_028341 [Gossypium arboreum]
MLYLPYPCADYNTTFDNPKLLPLAYTMSISRSKKTAVPILKKKKGPTSSSAPAAGIRHPFLQFLLGPQEKLFQILRARPLGVGRCIKKAALEKIQMADAVRALLTNESWELFFEIIEPTYLELTTELCSTFHLQVVMTNFDDPETEFGIAFGLYTEEFTDDNELNTLHRHIHYSPSKCWKDFVPASATYDPSRSKAPQHNGTIILPHSHRPDVPTGHLEHATYEDD